FKTGRIIRGALWILGEYAESVAEIRDVWTKLREAIGELPLLAAEQREALEAASGSSAPGDESSSHTNAAASTKSVSTSRRVLADGTYATESSLTVQASAVVQLDSKPPLRAVLLHSDFFTGTVLASTLAKLVLRFSALPEVASEEQGSSSGQLNALRAEAVLIMAGIIRIGQSAFVATPIDEDSYDRVLACIRALEHMNEDSEVLIDAFIGDTQSAFARLVKGEATRAAEEAKKTTRERAVQVDDAIGFRLLAKKGTVATDDDSLERDAELATGGGDTAGRAAVSKLDSVVQLTGFSDAVYAEAYVEVNQYDILLDIMV
ncbi:coatomer subunit beta, partial [Kickxella alabastrina]